MCALNGADRLNRTRRQSAVTIRSAVPRENRPEHCPKAVLSNLGRFGAPHARHSVSSGSKVPSSQGWSSRVARSDCSRLASQPWRAPLRVIFVIAVTSMVTTEWSGSSLWTTR